MTDKKDVTILDLDSMMDMVMDSIEAAPDYITPPPGTYMLKIENAKIAEYVPKPKDNKPVAKATRIGIQYSVVHTFEVEGTEPPVKDGALFSESFMGTSEGVKYFKRQAMNIMNVDEESLKGVSLKEVLEGLGNMQFKAKITIRKSAKDGGGEYENIQVRPIHEEASA